MTDFFGNVQNVELTKNRYPLVQQEDDEGIDATTLNAMETEQQSNTTTKTTKHLHHSFLVEKKTNTYYYIQSGLGVLATVAIGYVIATTIM